MRLGILLLPGFEFPRTPSTYVLLAALGVFAVWETYRPRRRLIAPVGRRWAHVGLLMFLVNWPLGWIYPVTAVMMASAVSAGNYGILNHAPLPAWVRFVIGFALLDLVRYAQHRLYHAIPLLWRMHSVHHADPDCDWSTGLLFHPGEVLLSQATYFGFIAFLAPPPLAVLCLEVANAAQNIFEHANIAISPRIDGFLRRILITPDLHHIHHSDQRSEQDRNFGTIFSCWDRLFRTYLPEPAAGQAKLRMGMPEVTGPHGLNVVQMLALPFRRSVSPSNS